MRSCNPSKIVQTRSWPGTCLWNLLVRCHWHVSNSCWLILAVTRAEYVMSNLWKIKYSSIHNVVFGPVTTTRIQSRLTLIISAVQKKTSAFTRISDLVPSGMIFSVFKQMVLWSVSSSVTSKVFFFHEKSRKPSFWLLLNGNQLTLVKQQHQGYERWYNRTIWCCGWMQ